ncbi:hypothetical protein SAMN04488505_1021172 [Chitinophaga rupis]|uniref:DUF3592 domain-containing protein n=1 Tax=Chitinophaga rupis TaxID=573321 RepID=A0A1H7T8K3_9BACT|nr:DUF3592 domain-containing protein [Chitinophaga rupis]SEL81221.1 hypothetical protein SAMN04488505_1021172 [Chitinophaga rupis]
MDRILSHIVNIAVLILIDFIVYRSEAKNLIQQYRNTAKLIRTGVCVKGLVTGFVNKEDLDQHPQYASIVEFIDKNGDNRQVTSDLYEYKEPRINSLVDVYYDKEDPAEILIDSGSILLFRFFLLALFVAIWLIINIGMLYEMFN